MTDIDLLSMILTLRPLEAASELNLLGRAAHALLLNAVRWSDPALAEELHSGDGLRPLSASNLIGYSRKRGLNPGQTYTLRFTALTEAVARALTAATGQGNAAPAEANEVPVPVVTPDREAPPLRPGAHVRLDASTFRIEAVTSERSQHPWAGSTTYEALSAPWLLGRAQPERRLTLEFNSPTTFKSRGRHVPAPLPDLVFGNLLERWNAFAPVAFPPETRQYAEECLALGAYRLRTHMVRVKDGGLRAGAVGWARYVTVNYDRYWMSLVNLLAEFAFYAGVGASTTIGLGQCRRVADVPPRGQGGGLMSELP